MLAQVAGCITQKKKDKNTTTTDPRHVTLTFPEITHPLLLSLPNQGNKRQLMIVSKSHFSFSHRGKFSHCANALHLVWTRFYFHNAAAWAVSRSTTLSVSTHFLRLILLFLPPPRYRPHPLLCSTSLYPSLPLSPLSFLLLRLLPAPPPPPAGAAVEVGVLWLFWLERR